MSYSVTQRAACRRRGIATLMFEEVTLRESYSYVTPVWGRSEK